MIKTQPFTSIHIAIELTLFHGQSVHTHWKGGVRKNNSKYNGHSCDMSLKFPISKRRKVAVKQRDRKAEVLLY